MSKIDVIYHDLLKDILSNGTKKQDRTGTGTVSVFGRQLRYDMSNGFPLLTTKRIHVKSVIYELLWFLQGNTNIQYLAQKGVNIWNDWPYKNYKTNWLKENPPMSGPYTESMLTEDEFIKKIAEDDKFAKEWGDLGPVYGKQWRFWQNEIVNYAGQKYDTQTIDQIQNIINDLKNNPDSRRIMCTAWNPSEIHNVALPPCHYGFQLWTRELSIFERIDLASKKYENFDIMDFGIPFSATHEDIDKYYPVPRRRVSLMWNQRSVDTLLGLPFNIASYAFLLEMFAQQADMVAGELTCNLGDTHIYLNHISYVEDQLSRDVEKFDAPTLTLNKADDILSYKFEDFKISESYKENSYPNWKNVPIAV